MSNFIKIIALSNPGTADDLRIGKSLIDGNGNIVSGKYIDEIDKLIDGTITEYSNQSIDIVGVGAFFSCTSLSSISFPVCTYIDEGAFDSCTNLTTVSFPACTYIAWAAFASCTSLTSVSFPACTYIDGWAFVDCTSLSTANFPVCSYIDNYAFNSCTSLTSVSFPVCTEIGYRAFEYCTNLTSVSFPACAYIDTEAFAHCTSLTSLTLGGSTVCTLSGNAFLDTHSSLSIYVPASLVNAYKSATNWAAYSSRITAIV